MQSLTTSLILFAGAASAAGFNYNDMGKNWSEIKGADGENLYSICATGNQQSPINLSKDGAKRSDNMQVDGYAYQNYATLPVVDKGYTIQVDGVQNGLLELNFHNDSKEEFSPLQWHVHAPSEHTVDGNNYDLELHLVHHYKDQASKFGAVIGVFFKETEGADDIEMFANLNLNNLAEKDGKMTAASGAMNVKSFLQDLNFTKYWQYNGSLTTPDCRQGIEWTVLETPVPINPKQLEMFTKRWAGNKDFAGGNGNNRAVQPIKSQNLHYSGALSLAATGLAALAALAF